MLGCLQVSGSLVQSSNPKTGRGVGHMSWPQLFQRHVFGTLLGTKVIVCIVPDCMSKCVLKTRCRKTGFPLVYSMCTPTSPGTFYVRMYAGNVNVYYVGS
jgi:hypothetical protein